MPTIGMSAKRAGTGSSRTQRPRTASANVLPTSSGSSAIMRADLEERMVGEVAQAALADEGERGLAGRAEDAESDGHGCLSPGVVA